jgi:hypothetical protein
MAREVWQRRSSLSPNAYEQVASPDKRRVAAAVHRRRAPAISDGYSVAKAILDEMRAKRRPSKRRTRIDGCGLIDGRPVAW